MTELDDIAAIRRHLALLVKLKLNEVKGDRSLTEMVHLLSDMGCGPSEIASLLGTTTASVNPILSRGRKTGKAQKKRR